MDPQKQLLFLPWFFSPCQEGLNPPSSHQPHSYRITKVHGEIVVLFREWILKLLAEVSVGDQERQRVHIQTELGP